VCVTKPEPSAYSEHLLATLLRAEFIFSFFFHNCFWRGEEGDADVSRGRVAMVFCVGCGAKLTSRYCAQCGKDLQATADVLSYDS
jgi:hypothetical protein